MEQPLILVVEDEHTISNFICRAMASAGYRALPAATGKEALTLFFSHRPDLVLLDLGLPDMDGLEVLEQVAADPQKDTPVIILSARDRESEKVKALDMGADDYIVKPFGVPEVLARIRTTLRHAQRVRDAAQGEKKERYQVKDLVVDTASHQVFVGDQEVHLTQNEFKLMELLCLHAGKVLTYDFVLKQVWGPYVAGGNQILRVNMANIRRKLGENPSEPKYIVTELGIGYRLLEDG
ncbi:DNA-binding response regulator [Oscillospiraceae bacterium]|nr:DNA-binding response regulator [Oscillospiraceae bacterium]